MKLEVKLDTLVELDNKIKSLTKKNEELKSKKEKSSSIPRTVVALPSKYDFRNMRDSLGETYSEVARNSGASYSAVRRLENGDSVAYGSVMKIHNYLTKKTLRKKVTS